MATNNRAASAAEKPARPELNTEVANRLRDPYENFYLGLIRTSDPLLLEKGGGYGQAFELYRDLKRDGKVYGSLQKRKLALISKPWQVEPVTESAKGTADAEIVAGILKRAQFDQVSQDMQEALIMGFEVGEVVWMVRDGYVVPKRIVKRANRRFVYKQTDENAPPQLRLLTRENMLEGEELPERKFIVHRFNPEDDNPYGTGLGLQLYWPVFFKRKGVISWNKLNDRFGSPTPHGKYPANASPAEKRTLLQALQAMSNDGTLVTPEGMSVELLESKLTGSVSSQAELCSYMDDWIDSVILGAESRAKGGGALAAASKERSDVRMDLVQADSDLISDTLNNSLLQWICELNGFEPCHVYRQVKEEEDLKAASDTDKNVASMGFEPSIDYIRSRYGQGWEKKAPAAPPVPPPGAVPPNKAPVPGADDAEFSEAGFAAGQKAIDDAIAAVPDAELQAAMGDLFRPLLKAIDECSSFPDALAAAEAAYPQMDPAKLQSLLARAMFGAETFGRAGETS